MATTILSYPDRGAGGSAAYRGNCSPHVVEFLLQQFTPRFFLDPMVGSGTSQDVCAARGIPGWFADLRQPFPGEIGRLPIRGQVTWGFNLLEDEIPVSGDMTFMHPPYGAIIKYSGQVWGQAADPRDLSQCPDEPTFVRLLNEALWRLWQSVRWRGHMAILIGDVVSKDRVFCPMREMTWPGTPVRVCIKEQHNVQSDSVRYAGGDRIIRQMHEYLLIFRRDEVFALPVIRAKRETADVRQCETVTWRAIVQMTLEELGGEAELEAIYQVVTTFKKAKGHAHPQEQVRRALQVYPDFQRRDRGRWALAKGGITHDW